VGRKKALGDSSRPAFFRLQIPPPIQSGEARYNLELDGSQHGFPEGQAKDEARDAYLKSRNIQTRRFWNSQLKNIRFVRETIWADLQKRAPHIGNQQPEKPARLPTRSKKSSASP
jgi:hypothetical protein